jgi:SAM-dependent methyltransferase
MRAVDPALLSLLQCPRCSAARSLDGQRSLVCRECGLEVESHPSGFVDLLDVATRGEPQATTREQRLMESPLVARLCERTWRPAFVRLMAGRGAGAAVGGFPGEIFIHKNSLSVDDREGPWLDLSCGPGLFTRALAASAPGALVVGLDISRPMLEVAAKRSKGYSNVALVRGDAHALPFVAASFGGVNNSGALHAYDDPELVFREVWRILRPGGLYVGSTFAEAPSLFGKIAARAAGIRRFDPDSLRSWLNRIGFADFEELRLEGALIFRCRKP